MKSRALVFTLFLSAAIFSSAVLFARGEKEESPGVLRYLDEGQQSGSGGAAGREGAETADKAEHRAQRDRLVAQTIESRGVTDPKVLEAMRRVPRHLFVPEDERRRAYTDQALPIGYGQTISAARYCKNCQAIL
jgi:hypothetical protein